MAKKQNGSARTTIEEVNEQITGAVQRVEDNKKMITYVLTGIVAVILLVAGYVYLVRNPNIAKAKEDISVADMALMQNDTAKALAQYLAVADQFSNKPANRAHLNAAIMLYQQGKFEQAAKQLEDYAPAGNLIGPASQSLLGDCYVNLKQYDKALSAFDKAVKLCDGNELYAPLFILKKATVLHEQGKYADEAAAYQIIKDKYLNFANENRVNVDKYIERANALAANPDAAKNLVAPAAAPAPADTTAAQQPAQ